MTDDQTKTTEQPVPRLNRTVIVLGFVSLLTDISSEMVYTQIPLFLTGVLGAPVAVVGLIEGVAESAASLLKLLSGWISDKVGRRKPLAVLGYGFGALSKPLLSLAMTWQAVLGCRFLDRVGKGLRTAPRDALIAETTPKALRGRAFGLHRAMDTTGAVLGPLLGVLALSWFHGDPGTKLRHLFVFAGIFGGLATLCLLLFVREKPLARPAPPDFDKPAPNLSLLQHWQTLTPTYRRFLFVALLFNLGNSSDAFLILRAQGRGFHPVEILKIYAAFNVVEAVLGYAAGRLSDRVGRRPLIVVGYLVFAAVYLGFAFAASKAAIWGLFLLYGGYYTLTQGTQRAFAADLADPAQKATQIGAYHTVVGLALLPASVIAGQLFAWRQEAPFILGAITAFCAAVLFMTLPIKPARE